jgi:hypothetical protein
MIDAKSILVIHRFTIKWNLYIRPSAHLNPRQIFKV